jgi:hypothetical protein
LVTSVLSATAHIVVLLCVAMPALYATDVLPEAKQMLAFVVEAPPPPPPPPPPRAPAPRPEPAVKPPPVARRAPAPESTKIPTVVAPVEEPEAITEETGFEGALARVDEPCRIR